MIKSDQERSLRPVLEEALRLARRDNPSLEQSVFEVSAVAESQSNGMAEDAVQRLEDLVRTYKSSLETRLECRIPMKHPVMRWMVEHAATMLNRFTTNPEGLSPYAAAHGRNASERHIEFCEKIFYFVPKKARTKLCLRWRLGTYLGMAPSSNECYVANVGGDVVRTRSVARVVAASR